MFLLYFDVIKIKPFMRLIINSNKKSKDYHVQYNIERKELNYHIKLLSNDMYYH